MLTINDKEAPMDIDRLIESVGPRPAPNLRWDRIITLSVLAAFFALLLFRPIRLRDGTVLSAVDAWNAPLGTQ